MFSFLNENTDLLDSVSQKDNSIVLSSLKEFYKPIKTDGFAIKYVVEGVEKYFLNGKYFPIKTGKYLLSNQTSEGHVEIESNRQVKGICINIATELLTEIVATQTRPDTAFSDLELGQFFTTSLFLENQYDAEKTNVGKMLFSVQNILLSDNLGKEAFDNEFFYAISEKIIEDQIPIFKQLQSIPSLKSETKKDLYKRVFRAKELMDESFRNPLPIEIIAQEACLSEYHFYRLFKSVFKQSPNQYLIQKRLNLAHFLLQKEKISVSVAATESGFSDIYTFSKAFKKQFGFSPSQISRI